ncbi:hypothetical protein MIMGU_mgv1a016616mg [Erythranthe guttata]|uniref:Uncharacterized protein n=1 Tax=Erythranthe guttata TaxID=4155 RepID=A0A022QEN4_ERYGU|nr:hypothetical protein MIMGU_mgv1a016616mg [Erythranthe guttata]
MKSLLQFRQPVHAINLSRGNLHVSTNLHCIQQRSSCGISCFLELKRQNEIQRDVHVARLVQRVASVSVLCYVHYRVAIVRHVRQLHFEFPSIVCSQILDFRKVSVRSCVGRKIL